MPDNNLHSINKLQFTSFFEILRNSMNINILIFDILLGMVVVLMAKSGGSAAYGKWAGTKIKTKRSALLATMGLGVLIFVDDYFNCLTVGSVMRPVTDSHKVSRAKLAYIIDSTAAPICIIAPISSWAAAVNSYVPADAGISGFQLFLRTIPYNLYAILTIAMVFYICYTGFDFGQMKLHEDNAAKGDVFTTGGEEFEQVSEQEVNPNGKVIDLVCCRSRQEGCSCQSLLCPLHNHNGFIIRYTGDFVNLLQQKTGAFRYFDFLQILLDIRRAILYNDGNRSDHVKAVRN